MVQREVNEEDLMLHTNASVNRCSIRDFDELPATAFVSLSVVCTLFACSPATVWRRVRDGLLVEPHRIGKRTTRWNVGELREVLAKV